MQAIGIGGMLFGLIVAMAGGGGWGALVMVLSLGVYGTGRYQAWWHHR